MKKSDLGVIAFLYLVGFSFLKWTFDLPDAAQTYPLFLVCTLLFLTTLYTVVQLVKYFKTRTVENDIAKNFANFIPGQFFGVVFACIAYLVLMRLIGYYIASLIFLIGCMLFLRVKLTYIAITTVVMVVLVYVVFSWFLKVPLPAGTLLG